MKELLKGHAGDVQFRQIGLIPVGFKKVDNKPIAVGSSGHCHVVTGNVERYELDDKVIYKLNGASRLQHTDISLMNEQTYSSPELLPIKDHKPILLPAGIYQFFIQKTYNTYTKLMEQVRD